MVSEHKSQVYHPEEDTFCSRVAHRSAYVHKNQEQEITQNDNIYNSMITSPKI